MTTHPLSPDDDHSADETMQNRLKNMFSGQEPPALAGLREVEAMKARIRDLEAELETIHSRAADAGQHPDPSRGVRASTEVHTLSRTVRTKGSAGLTRLLDWLASASSHLTDFSDRRSARLAASFLLTIA